MSSNSLSSPYSPPSPSSPPTKHPNTQTTEKPTPKIFTCICTFSTNTQPAYQNISYIVQYSVQYCVQCRVHYSVQCRVQYSVQYCVQYVVQYVVQYSVQYTVQNGAVGTLISSSSGALRSLPLQSQGRSRLVKMIVCCVTSTVGASPEVATEHNL